MTDELKLGLYSVRDDTSILNIQSSDLNAYIFSTRDDPSKFEGGNLNKRVVIFDGTAELEYEVEEIDGNTFYANTLFFDNSGCELGSTVTKLFVTLDNGEELILPKGNYDNILDPGYSMYGEYDFVNNLPDFTNYPLLISHNSASGSADIKYALEIASTQEYQHYKIEALESEVTVTKPIPTDLVRIFEGTVLANNFDESEFTDNTHYFEQFLSIASKGYVITENTTALYITMGIPSGVEAEFATTWPFILSKTDQFNGDAVYAFCEIDNNKTPNISFNNYPLAIFFDNDPSTNEITRFNLAIGSQYLSGDFTLLIEASEAELA